MIKLLHSGERYNSPSQAACAVMKKKAINGWRLWKYKAKNGELVFIDELRKKK